MRTLRYRRKGFKEFYPGASRGSGANFFTLGRFPLKTGLFLGRLKKGVPPGFPGEGGPLGFPHIFFFKGGFPQRVCNTEFFGAFYGEIHGPCVGWKTPLVRGAKVFVPQQPFLKRRGSTNYSPCAWLLGPPKYRAGGKQKISPLPKGGEQIFTPQGGNNMGGGGVNKRARAQLARWGKPGGGPPRAVEERTTGHIYGKTRGPPRGGSPHRGGNHH